MKKPYKDLISEIKIIEEMIEALNATKAATVKVANISKERTPEEVKRYIAELKEINKKLEIYEETLIILNNCKKNILDQVNNMKEGLHKQVYYLHNIEDKTLLEISIMLNYDYQYIRRVHAEAKKKMGANVCKD